jgi:hypothetical protein
VLIKPAAAPAYVKQKDLLRHIRDAYPDAWVASCGALLEKADAALEETEAGTRREIPKTVVDKWQAAFLKEHGKDCTLKNITHLSGSSGGGQRKIKGWHIFKFELAGVRPPARVPRVPHVPHPSCAPPMSMSTYPAYPTYPTPACALPTLKPSSYPSYLAPCRCPFPCTHAGAASSFDLLPLVAQQ